MSDPTAPDSAAATEGTAAPAEPSAAAPAPEAVRAAALERDAAEARDRVLRMAAEMENLRKRTEREVADARQYAVTSIARDMVTVAENLRRALDSIPADAANAALETLRSGVELTDRELQKVFGRHGIRRVDPAGEKFDPNLHQAVYEMETADAPTGTVVKVFEAGYAIHDRVLRPAMVGVAKAMKAAPAAAATVPASADASAAASSDSDGDSAANSNADASSDAEASSDGGATASSA